MTASGEGVSLWGDEGVLELDGGDGCTILRICKNSLSGGGMGA